MKRRAAAVVVLLLTALPAAAQRGPSTRVPGGSGWPRVPTGPVSIGIIHPERRDAGTPFRGPVPFPPLDRQWLRLETPHFTFISSATDRKTRAVAEDFEKLTAILTRTSPLFRPHANRTRVFVFADDRDVRPYIDAIRGVRVDAAGVTFRHADGTTMLLNAGVRGGSVITPRHELVHDLLRRAERPLPLWIEEGLAEYYSNAGMPIREHASRMRGGLRMPLPALFEVRGDSPRATSFDFYAQSWAAVATLMRRNPRAFFEFVSDLDNGATEVAALSTRYRMSLKDLEAAMRNAGAPAASVLFHGVDFPARTSPIDRAELLYELGTLLGRVKGREDEAERHFLASIEADPERGAAYLAYAEYLLTRPECRREARAYADEALDYEDANETRAHAVIALSYLGDNDAESATPYLHRAFEGAPDRLDIAYPLFTISVEQGDRETAEFIFPRLADTHKGSDARRLLLRVDIPRADALAREGKLIEAARILRDLAPKMPGKTRTSLETQAAGLEAAAKHP